MVFVLGTVAVLGLTTTLIANQLLLQRIGGVVTILMGLVFIGFVPALQREARFTPRQLSTIGGAPAARRGVRAGLDAVPGPDADRRDRGGVGDRRRERGAGRRARRRLLPRASESRSCCWHSGRRGPCEGLGWLRRHTRAIQIFGGVLLILVGIALVTGLWADFISWVRDAFVSDMRLPI